MPKNIPQFNVWISPYPNDSNKSFPKKMQTFGNGYEVTLSQLRKFVATFKQKQAGFPQRQQLENIVDEMMGFVGTVQ